MLAVNIIAKKLVLKEQTSSDDEEESSEWTFMYYLNDGVYGSFNWYPLRSRTREASSAEETQIR